MKRVVKYWAIRLLGREFLSLSWKQCLSGIWAALSFFFLLILADNVSGWVIFCATLNMAVSFVVAYKQLNNVFNPYL